MTDSNYSVYGVRIGIELTKKVDRYSSDRLVHLSVEREVPAHGDNEAKALLHEIADDELRRALDVVQERIQFDLNVKALMAGGEAIDA